MAKKTKKTKSKRGSGKQKKVSNTGKRTKVPKTGREALKGMIFNDYFTLWNGDVYVGEFTFDAEGKMLRSGRGVYVTADGHMLSGVWQDDVLVVAEMVVLPDRSWYRGPLENQEYSGHGTYSIPQLGALECRFVRGRPQGEELLTLTDLDGCKWQGHTIAGGGSVTLNSRNHFYDSEYLIHKSLQNSS